MAGKIFHTKKPSKEEIKMALEKAKFNNKKKNKKASEASGLGGANKPNNNNFYEKL